MVFFLVALNLLVLSLMFLNLTWCYSSPLMPFLVNRNPPPVPRPLLLCWWQSSFNALEFGTMEFLVVVKPLSCYSTPLPCLCFFNILIKKPRHKMISQKSNIIARPWLNITKSPCEWSLVQKLTKLKRKKQYFHVDVFPYKVCQGFMIWPK
jgi:hypothetical protein